MSQLECTHCSAVFPVEYGIPRMLPQELLETDDETAARKRSEMQARDAQVDAYDRMWYLTLFGKVEVPLTLRWCGAQPTHTMLEAGCGTGRMTPKFASACATLVSIDFSWESLLACRRKLESAGITSVHLVQADLCSLPFRENAFDCAASCQVLEHLPGKTSREAAVRGIARSMKPGARLAISAYQYGPLMRLFTRKEGEHDGGIYFYRFARNEFVALLQQQLKVEAVTGALIYHYTARCRKEGQ